MQFEHVGEVDKSTQVLIKMFPNDLWIFGRSGMVSQFSRPDGHLSGDGGNGEWSKTTTSTGMVILAVDDRQINSASCRISGTPVRAHRGADEWRCL